MSRKRAWLGCFLPHRLELYLSPAWKLRPTPLARILERLEVEHLRHGGQNNGELYVSFGQFVEAGVSRRNILHLLRLGDALGLLEVRQDEEHGGNIRAPNAYRLTYVPNKGKHVPTDEWKAVNKEAAEKAIRAYRQADQGSCEAKARRAA